MYLTKLEESKDAIKKYGIKRIGVFGSYIRGKQKSTSDIDILVEFEKATTWRNGTRMTRIVRIFTDTESVCIRVIRAIRVLSRILWNFAPSAVEFLRFTYHLAPFMEV